MASTLLGNRIKISRDDLGLTQHQLAKLSGVSRSYIGNLERKRRTNIGSDIVIKLASALNVSPLYLIETEDDPLHGIPDDPDEEEKDEGKPLAILAQDDKVARTVANPEIELLITIYRLIDPEKRQILLNMAKVLRDVETPRIIGDDPQPDPPAHPDRETPPT